MYNKIKVKSSFLEKASCMAERSREYALTSNIKNKKGGHRVIDPIVLEREKRRVKKNFL